MKSWQEMAVGDTFTLPFTRCCLDNKNIAWSWANKKLVVVRNDSNILPNEMFINGDGQLDPSAFFGDGWATDRPVLVVELVDSRYKPPPPKKGE